MVSFASFLDIRTKKRSLPICDYQKYFTTSLIMIILMVKNLLKIIKSLRSARLALSKSTIAPTCFLGIYELMLNTLVSE